MSKIHADAFDAISQMQLLIPKGWKITVEVPTEEIEDVWPVLHKYLNENFKIRGILKNTGVVEIAPMIQ